MLRAMDLDPTSEPMLFRDARSAGATVRRLRASDLAAPTRGARVGALRHDLDPRGALLGSLRLLARDDQFFSHSTAARIHGMPLPPRLADDDIHLASPTRTVRTRRRGVVGHRVKAEVVEVDGIRVESIPDAFVHLGMHTLSVAELVEVGDWIVHPSRRPRIGAGDLRSHARHFAGARGLQTVHAALPLLRAGADSPGETRTRLLLRAHGLPEPVLQHPVRDAGGRLVATLDLAYPAHRVGIEYEGAHHRLDAEQFDYDIRRYAALDALGWRIVRVTHADIVERGRRILPLIRAACRTSGQ
jgi:hypothetical protein